MSLAERQYKDFRPSVEALKVASELFRVQVVRDYKESTMLLFGKKSPSEVEDPDRDLQFDSLEILSEGNGTGFESVDLFYQSWRRSPRYLARASFTCTTPLPIPGTSIASHRPSIHIFVFMGTTTVTVSYPNNDAAVARIMDPFEAEYEAHKKTLAKASQKARKKRRATEPETFQVPPPPAPETETTRSWWRRTWRDHTAELVIGLFLALVGLAVAAIGLLPS
jgi:hypothetical protein